MDKETRIHNATSAAQEAFWATVAAHYPEIKTGDFPPGATLAFDGACASAVTTWVTGNEEVDQEAMANDAFTAYQFGDGISVVEFDGWETDMNTADGVDDWIRVAYVVCDDDPPGADSHKVSFHVKFVQGRPEVEEVYAYWVDTGAELGTPGSL